MCSVSTGPSGDKQKSRQPNAYRDVVSVGLTWQATMRPVR